MYNVYLSIFIIVFGFAFASNLKRIFIRTIPFSHQESYLITNWILTMCDVIELLHCRVCTTRDDSCRTCVKIGLCNWVVFARETVQFEEDSNFSDSEIDKWSHNHFRLWSFTNFKFTAADYGTTHLKATPRKQRNVVDLRKDSKVNSICVIDYHIVFLSMFSSVVSRSADFEKQQVVHVYNYR